MGNSISVQITRFVGSDMVLKEVGEQCMASFSLAVNRTNSFLMAEYASASQTAY